LEVLIAGLQVTLPDPVTLIVSPLDAELTHDATDVRSALLVHVGLEPEQAASAASANEKTQNNKSAQWGIRSRVALARSMWNLVTD
jgi:hypothetical protein